VKAAKQVKEIKAVNEVKEKSRGVAAFFDLDGTLVALPSMERRLLRTMKHRGELAARNYLLWLKEAIRLLPRGIDVSLQANKMYLRGVHTFDESDEEDGNYSSSHKSGHQAWGQAPSPPRRNPRLPVPSFFVQAIERVAWHVKQGHAIVLVSGTLEPLAWGAAGILEAELAARGIAAAIRVCATRLEEMDGQWTGRVLGDAMFGEAKARATMRLAEEMRLDLTRCYAYGDSLHDRSLLEAVGKPAAVNSCNDLAEIARMRGWALLRWNKETELTQRTQSSQRAQRKERKNNDAPLEKSVLRRAERCA
jgi:HAD superfamily hydrolase (TIGR01490 family)